MLGHERDEVLWREARQGGAAEVWVLRQIVGGAGADVGEVAAAAARDADLLADRLGMVDQRHPAATLTRTGRAKEAGGAGADDDCVEVARSAHAVNVAGIHCAA